MWFREYLTSGDAQNYKVARRIYRPFSIRLAVKHEDPHIAMVEPEGTAGFCANRAQEVLNFSEEPQSEIVNAPSSG